jgi:hypothetical protein
MKVVVDNGPRDVAVSDAPNPSIELTGEAVVEITKG